MNGVRNEEMKIKEMGSRYLFICVYIWLEKGLSRGGYKSKFDEEPPRYFPDKCLPHVRLEEDTYRTYDCYISLHRSAGFELTIAEPMAIVRPPLPGR